MHGGINVTNACEEARNAHEENIRSFFFGSLIFLNENECMPNVELKTENFAYCPFFFNGENKMPFGLSSPKGLDLFGGKHPHFCVGFQILVYNKQYQRTLKCFYFHLFILPYLAKLGYRSLPHQRYHKIGNKKEKQDQTVVAWR